MDYRKIRKEYPEYISKDQMYRICHISKEKAKFLLDTGLVKCTISDKKTRKYRIALAEVIKYLRNQGAIDSQVPRGIKSPLKKARDRIENKMMIHPGYSNEQLTRFLMQRFRVYDDVVDTRQLADMLGFSRSHTQKLIQDGIVKSIKMKERLYLIPKQYVIEYMTGAHYRGPVFQSPNYKGVWNDFFDWLNSDHGM